MNKTRIYFGKIDLIERDGKQYAEIHDGYAVGEIEARNWVEALKVGNKRADELGMENFFVPYFFPDYQVVIMQKPKYVKNP